MCMYTSRIFVCVASCGAWPLKYVYSVVFTHMLTFQRRLSQRTPIVTHTHTRAHALHSFFFIVFLLHPCNRQTLIQTHMDVDDDSDGFVVVSSLFRSVHLFDKHHHLHDATHIIKNTLYFIVFYNFHSSCMRQLTI